MKNQIDGKTKKSRVKEILKPSNEFEKNYYQKYINKVLEGVTELKKDGTILVHTTNFIPVILKEKKPNNIILKVKIKSVDEEHNVYGEVV